MSLFQVFFPTLVQKYCHLVEAIKFSGLSVCSYRMKVVPLATILSLLSLANFPLGAVAVKRLNTGSLLAGQLLVGRGTIEATST